MARGSQMRRVSIQGERPKARLSFELALGNGKQRAAQHLCLIGCVVQGKTDRREEEALAQDRPEQALADAGDHRQKRAHPVVEKPQLYQQRRAAKEGAIAARQEPRQSAAADLSEGEAYGDDEAEHHGDHQQANSLPGAGQKQRPIGRDPGETHGALSSGKARLSPPYPSLDQFEDDVGNKSDGEIEKGRSKEKNEVMLGACPGKTGGERQFLVADDRDQRAVLGDRHPQIGKTRQRVWQERLSSRTRRNLSTGPMPNALAASIWPTGMARIAPRSTSVM